MVGKDVRRIREKLEMDRDGFAEFLCLSGYNALMNIENGYRRPGKFVLRFLYYLDSLSNTKAKGLIKDLSEHEYK